MTMQDIPLDAVRAVAVVFYLICLAALFCAARTYGHPAVRKTFFFSLCIALLIIPTTSSLAIYCSRIRNGEPLESLAPVVRSVVALPVWAAGVFAVLLIAAVSVMFVHTERKLRGELSAQSLCEGLDQLSDGVCYSLPDGFPQLVNNKMQQIGNAAIGVGVLDARALEKRLEERDLLPGCTVDERDGNVFLRLPDGSVWQMKQKKIAAENRELTEMIAYDVTRRYNDLLELEMRNRHLEEVNRQIREYDRDMDRIVREREILAAKIRLHNDLGQCLLAVGNYLNGIDGSRETVVRQLADTVSLLRDTGTREQNSDRLSALYEAARAVDMTIELHGEIPPEHKEIAAVAIHECLTNTVKHADGSVVRVTVRQEDGAVVMELTNDGRPPRGPIKETGGLKNLRALAERKGGRMTVESAPAFRLTLRFAC
ncbi:MAG: hypothetical protein IJK23_11025 [Clostridia bacterium]|nr:hypothetical protein [Clostridia bacterium]